MFHLILYLYLFDSNLNQFDLILSLLYLVLFDLGHDLMEVNGSLDDDEVFGVGLG